MNSIPIKQKLKDLLSHPVDPRIPLIVGGLLTFFMLLLMSLKDWGAPAGGLDNIFAWHPILMTMAYTVFMPLARIGTLGPEKKTGAGRAMHAVFMSVSVIFMFWGFRQIWQAHLNFKKSQVKSTNFGRTFHIWLGYIICALTLLQMLAGVFKLAHLSEGVKKIPLHGKVGSAIITIAALEIFSAACFTDNWPSIMQAIIALLSALFGVTSFLSGNPLKCSTGSTSKSQSASTEKDLEREGTTEVEEGK